MQLNLSKLAVAAFSLSLLSALLAVSAGFGHRFGFWHFGFGFSLLSWAVYGAIAGGVLAIASLFIARVHGRWVWASAALVITLAVVLVPLQWLRIARAVPPIHDISTNTENPPQFIDILPLRHDAPNPPQYGGAAIAKQQRSAYPNIQTLVLHVSAEEAFPLVLKTAEQMGWNIVASKPYEGRIEAVDTTFWFGFKDDIVIRISPKENSTSVDIRSVSRVGRSDVGTNAKRITRFLRKLREHVE
jgi:uncharacterized protein (DUF1499 family)